MNMMRADMSDVKRLEKDLKLFARRAMPYATKFTLNNAARKAMFKWRDNMRENLILRNQWTVKSTSFLQAKSNNINNQRSVVGSRAEYMKRTEEGGTVTNDGKAVPIATSYAAKQTGRRTRMPIKSRSMRNITLTSRNVRSGRRRVMPANETQAAILMVREAIRTKNRFIFLEGRTFKTRGIYRVVGGSLRSGRGWPKGAKLRLVQNLEHRTVVVPATPTLAGALDSINADMPKIYRDALTFQLRRHKVFGY